MCMVDGRNNNEIAEMLVVSLGTVKFHISNIFHRLGVDSPIEAVKLAIEKKSLTLPVLPIHMARVILNQSQMSLDLACNILQARSI